MGGFRVFRMQRFQVLPVGLQSPYRMSLIASKEPLQSIAAAATTQTVWKGNGDRSWVSRCCILVLAGKICCDPADLYEMNHDDTKEWNHFLHNWSLWWESTGQQWNPLAKGQWHGTLMSPFMPACANTWTNSREADELRCLSGHWTSLQCGKSHQKIVMHYMYRM